MTSLSVARRASAPVPAVEPSRHPWVWVVLATVLLRLPGLAAAPGIDESGFLMVARQWGRGGSSLYGDYWVDRPPLLITLYRVAALTGGLVPLRLLGCLAAALTVAAVGHGARLLVPPPVRGRAVLWAALVAGALCSSPLLGAVEVNGELLAAPFVAWGIVWSLGALGARGDARARALGAAAGAACAAAVLVKQNEVDVAVFLAAAVILGCRRRTVTARRGGQIVAGAVAGGAAVLLVTAGWTVLHGTSLPDLYDALYPFRVAAGRVLAAGDGAAVAPRRTALVARVLVSGLPLLVLLTVGAFWRHRLAGAHTAAGALGAVLLWDGVSIAAGGSYWSHYLVQLVVPVGLLTAAVVGRGIRGARVVAAATVAAALGGWVLVVPSAADRTSEATALGSAVGRVARPTDTLVTLYGHSDVSRASGLGSPYPYLWSLPLKTLDPHLTRLDRVLTGPDRPTWIVTWSGLDTWGVDASRTGRILARHYRVVAVQHGHAVYLADGAQRAAPGLSAT